MRRHASQERLPIGPGAQREGRVIGDTSTQTDPAVVEDIRTRYLAEMGEAA